jgi:hypothetical protein
MHRNSARLLRHLALLPALLAVAALRSQTTLALSCVKDNTLYESATGSLSNGLGNGLFVGVTGQPGLRRALLQFDIAAAVPAGARIVDAQLNLYCMQSAFGGPLDVTMHRVLQSWGEGTSRTTGGGGGGTAARPGDATWLHRFHSNSFWNSPGGDFVPSPSATIVTPPFGTCNSTVTNALLADVQLFLDSPAQNHGWLLKTDELTAYMARKIESRHGSFLPPSLSLTYILPGQSSVIGQGCPILGQPFSLQVQGALGGGNTAQVLQTQGPPNQLAVNLLSLGFSQPGIPLLAQCNLHLPLGGLIVTNNVLVLDGSGAGTTALTLPGGFAGTLLALQSAALANGSAGYTLTNAVVSLLQ